MKKLALVCVAALALAACDNGKPHSTTTVSSTSDASGVLVKDSLQMSAYGMRAALGNNPNTAAYVTVANKGNSEDRLLSASCSCATSTTLHTMEMTGDVMKMAEVKDGFVIKSGDTLTFAPGGNHIMLEGLTQRPKEGETVNVILVFEKAGPITLAMPVSNAPLAKPGVSDGHDYMKM